MKRTKICRCGKVFEYEIGRGKDRIHCSRKCQENAFIENRESKKELLPKCATLGCEKKANRRGAGLCEGCYMRLRRKGTTDYRSLPYRLDQSAGYVWLREPGHPLSDSRGLVYEHRYVYYKAHGRGPFKCHWCGRDLDWGFMVVDHLDDNKSNNNIENLVPSCDKCNTGRGTWKMVKARREQWTRITFDGITKNLSEWARERGLSRSALQWRLDHWPVERVMAEGRGVTGPRAEREQIDAMG